MLCSQIFSVRNSAELGGIVMKQYFLSTFISILVFSFLSSVKAEADIETLTLLSRLAGTASGLTHAANQLEGEDEIKACFFIGSDQKNLEQAHYEAMRLNLTEVVRSLNHAVELVENKPVNYCTSFVYRNNNSRRVAVEALRNAIPHVVLASKLIPISN